MQKIILASLTDFSIQRHSEFCGNIVDWHCKERICSTRALFIMTDDYFVDRFTKEHFSFKLTLFIYSSYANNISFTCKGYV